MLGCLWNRMLRVEDSEHTADSQLASLFNHSSKPNVNYIRDTKSGTITFTTCRRVHVDEELCICYSADESKLWFSPSHAGPNGTGPSSHDAHNAASLTTPLNAVNSRHSVGSADSFDGVASGLENHGIQSEEGVVLPHVDPELFEAEDQKDRDARREVRRLRLEEEHAAAMFRRQQRMAEYRGSDGRPGPRMDASNSGDPTNAGGPSGSSGSSASSALTNPSSTNQPNGILSPQPIPFTIISPALPASYSTPTLSAISDLPPPLHSSPTPSPNTPPDSGGTADLTPDLGWHEGDWYDANGEKKEVESQEEWGLLERIKGFGEDVEDSSLTSKYTTIETVSVESQEPRTQMSEGNWLTLCSPSMGCCCRRRSNDQRSAQVSMPTNFRYRIRCVWPRILTRA